MESILVFIIILSILVLVHELGHFISAKRHGIKVEEFGFGYPPRVWGIKRGETIYSLNLLPFGGFVRMMGEDSQEQLEKGADVKRAFFSQKKVTRVIVLMAGVTMNFLLGVVIFGAIYTKLGIPEPVNYLTVNQIAQGSPAEKAGLKLNDKIVGAEGIDWPENKENLTVEFVEQINQKKGETVVLYLEDGQRLELVPRIDEETPEGEGALGVVISNVDFVAYPYWQRPFRGMWLGIQEALAWGREIVVSLGQLFVRLFAGEVPKDVAGPVGIYQISKSASDQGWLASLQFMAILSINLSILNLLPLPALDGGRLVFVMIEAITRKRVKPQVEQTIHLIGIALLLGLMVLVTINDIRRLLG